MLATSDISQPPSFRIGRFTFALERGVPVPSRQVAWRPPPAPCRYFQPRPLRWSLSPERRDRLLAHLEANGTADAMAFRDLLEFVTTCGPRIEEALRLTTRDVVLEGSRPRVTLPSAEGRRGRVTLPLPAAAVALLRRRVAAISSSPPAATGDRLWPCPYTWARDRWRACRVIIGASQEPTATLKALRRSAAAHLHVTLGKSLAETARYLRHRHIETTLEYLRVTGTHYRKGDHA